MVEKKDEDFKTHYVVNATGIQVVKTKLTGVIPAIPMESIKFYSTWILTEKTQHEIPSSEVMKVAKLIRKKRHYYNLQSIFRVHEPEGHPTWEQRAYYILMGRGKKDGVVLGFLYYLANTSYVMGIWPAENVKRYEMTDKNARQNLFLTDLKKFQNPKLWKEVYFFTPPL
ncbi:MAG: hypothetical protein WBH31_06720 [Promethearchaeia archaeon]